MGGLGHGDDPCVGVETCRGLTGGIPVDDGEAVVRFSLPLVLPPLRERLGPARSGTARPEMPSTRGAIRQPGQRPPPPRPFSGGRRTGRGDGDGPGRWFGVLPRTARRCARHGPGRSRRLSLPLVLPPPRERRGPTRSAAGRGKMPSTRGAMREPEQKPPPPRPFSRGRRTGRGEARCVGPESYRGLPVLRPSWTGAFAPVVPPSWSPSSEGETRPGTFCRRQRQDAIDGRGDTPPRAETSAPESLLQREKDRKRGWRWTWALVPSPTEDCEALRPSWTRAFASVVPPSCSPSSEGETRPYTFCRRQRRDAIDERGDA